MSGFTGSMATRPFERVSTNPMRVHVAPASVDLYTPSPHDELCRVFASPVPAQTMFGFDFDTAIAPIDIIASTLSNTGAHVTPPLTLLKMPPLADATYTASGLPG